MAVTAGYDVGGAHLKVAVADGGRLVAVEQVACPLWRGLDRLDAALAQVAPLVARADRHAATMTGELCELFPNRLSGVAAILDRLAASVGDGISIWMGRRGLGALDEARGDPMSVASTNFLASATLVGERVPDALLIDMGSTTTDIIPIAGGRPTPRGLTDGERLATGELVYSGLTRTDVTAVVRSGTLRGRKQRLAAGGFATMADVRRILGTLPADADQHETADNRGKSAEESMARFARVFGCDRVDATDEEWREAARLIAQAQMTEIQAAMTAVLSGADQLSGGPVVVAGIGASEIETLIQQGRTTRAFGDLIEAEPGCREWATRCAPAVAVALLAGVR
jgi:probable H4MPT-linked C1 transfer pathway protein